MRIGAVFLTDLRLAMGRTGSGFAPCYRLEWGLAQSSEVSWRILKCARVVPM